MMALIQLFGEIVGFSLNHTGGHTDLLLFSHKTCAAFVDELGCYNTRFMSTVIVVAD
jgi:hypothetical protein